MNEAEERRERSSSSFHSSGDCAFPFSCCSLLGDFLFLWRKSITTRGSGGDEEEEEERNGGFVIGGVEGWWYFSICNLRIGMACVVAGS